MQELLVELGGEATKLRQARAWDVRKVVVLVVVPDVEGHEIQRSRGIDGVGARFHPGRFAHEVACWIALPQLSSCGARVNSPY